MRPKQTDFETFKKLIVQCLENNQTVYSNLKKADLDKGLLERQDVELILTAMDGGGFSLPSAFGDEGLKER